MLMEENRNIRALKNYFQFKRAKTITMTTTHAHMFFVLSSVIFPISIYIKCVFME